jgi:tape measure domain-containing protein
VSTNVGYATLQIIPVAKGFTSALQGQTTPGSRAAGTAAGREFGRSFDSSAGRALQQTGARLGRVLKTTLIATAAAGTAALAALGAAGLKAASDFQQASIAFETLLGSGEKAKAFLGDLREFAKSTPFGLSDLTKSSQQLLAYGFAAEQILPILTAAGDAAAGLGGTSETVAGIVRALGQMNAAGRVKGQEILQLSEVGVPALRILADTFGKTTGEIQKMIEKGLIPADVGVAALVNGIENGTKTTVAFGGLMEKQALTLAGVWSNVKDSVQIALVDGLAPALPAIAEAFDALIPSLTGFAEAFGSVLGPTLAAIATDVGPALTSLLQSLAPVVTTLVGALGPLIATIAPVLGSVATALGAILVPVVEALQPALEALAPAVQNFAAALGNELARVAPQLAPSLLVIAETLSQVFVALTPLIPAFGELARIYFPLLATVLQVVSRGIGVLGYGLAALLGLIADSFGQVLTDVANMVAGWVANIARIVEVLPGISDETKQSVRDLAVEIQTTGVKASGAMRGVSSAMGAVQAQMSNLAQGVTIPIQVVTYYTDAKDVASAKVAASNNRSVVRVPAKAKAPAIKAPALSLPSGGGGGGGKSAAQTAAEKAAEAVKDARESLRQSIGAGFVSGLITEDRAALKAVLAAVAKDVRGAFSGAREKALLGRIKRSRTQLLSYASDLKTVRAGIERATGRLDALKSEKASYVQGIADDLRGTLNIGNLVRSDGLGLPGFQEVSNYVASKVEKVRKLTTAVRRLIAAGLSRGMIEQILAAGPDAGLALANAILSGGSGGIASLNTQTAELDRLSKEFGDYAGSKFFDAGIQTAQGLLDGLKAKETEIEAAMTRIAKSLAAAVKKALGIKSPSRVMAALGRYTVQGFALGVEQDAYRAQAAMIRATTPPSPSLGSPGAPGGPMGGLVIQPAPVILDGRQVAEVVFDHGGRAYAYGR